MVRASRSVSYTHLVDDLSYIDEVEESDVDLRERLIYYRDGGFEALHELALLHRAKSEATFIAITGTNGKTTTKELVATVLSAKYRVHATQGNYNNEIEMCIRDSASRVWVRSVPMSLRS